MTTQLRCRNDIPRYGRQVANLSNDKFEITQNVQSKKDETERRALDEMHGCAGCDLFIHVSVFSNES